MRIVWGDKMEAREVAGTMVEEQDAESRACEDMGEKGRIKNQGIPSQKHVNQGPPLES